MLLTNVVYSYKYMHDWENFNEKSLPEKEEFYGNLNKGDNTDADFMHAKRVCKVFQIKQKWWIPWFVSW